MAQGSRAAQEGLGQLAHHLSSWRLEGRRGGAAHRWGLWPGVARMGRPTWLVGGTSGFSGWP